MPVKRTNTRRRDSSENPKITLAVVQEQLGQMAEGQERILHILEGNGKPGLVDRVKELEDSGDARGHDIKTLIDQVTGLATSVNSLANSVNEHIRPDNPQHKTFIAFVLRSPKDLVWWLGIISGVYAVLSASGAIKALGVFLAGAH